MNARLRSCGVPVGINVVRSPVGGMLGATKTKGTSNADATVSVDDAFPTTERNTSYMLFASCNRNLADGMDARWRSSWCRSVLSYDLAATDSSLYCRGWDYAFSCCGRVSTILWRYDGDLNCKGDLFGDP